MDLLDVLLQGRIRLEAAGSGDVGVDETLGDEEVGPGHTAGDNKARLGLGKMLLK